MTTRTLLLTAVLVALIPFPAGAQSPTDMAALKGLAPVSVLAKTPEGSARRDKDGKVRIEKIFPNVTPKIKLEV
jgi:hypothetical protein